MAGLTHLDNESLCSRCDDIRFLHGDPARNIDVVHVEFAVFPHEIACVESARDPARCHVCFFCYGLKVKFRESHQPSGFQTVMVFQVRGSSSAWPSAFSGIEPPINQHPASLAADDNIYVKIVRCVLHHLLWLLTWAVGLSEAEGRSELRTLEPGFTSGITSALGLCAEQDIGELKISCNANQSPGHLQHCAQSTYGKHYQVHFWMHLVSFRSFEQHLSSMLQVSLLVGLNRP